MHVSILLASGDTDDWENVADAAEDRGSLVVLGYLPDEVPEGAKIFAVQREIDQGPDLPTATKIETYKVVAIYAPGMWMKVEFS